MTLLITKAVPMKRLNGLFLPFIGSQLLVAFIIGMIIRALTSMVVSLELRYTLIFLRIFKHLNASAAPARHPKTKIKSEPRNEKLRE
ncbi:hypothetical protein D5086_030628 [Populus alba]|uniref:Uncharacterized protein n=1 Tax=Populus alba TaxID=43335 RepID=A0ACC4AP26_POPAL